MSRQTDDIGKILKCPKYFVEQTIVNYWLLGGKNVINIVTLGEEHEPKIYKPFLLFRRIIAICYFDIHVISV